MAMHFTDADFQLFYRLYMALLFYANQQLRIVTQRCTGPDDFRTFEPRKLIQIRDGLLANRELIHQFVAQNPFELNSTELAVVYDWKDAVCGDLYIFRYSKQHTIFLDCQNGTLAYGVVPIGCPMEDMIGPQLPQLFRTALLPYQGKIICDGLLSGPNLHLDLDRYLARMLNELYEDAVADYGIVTSLPFTPAARKPDFDRQLPVPPPPRSRPPAKSKGEASDYPLQLTRAQRKVIGESLPELKPRLLLEESNPRVVRFTREQLHAIVGKCSSDAGSEPRTVVRKTLLRVAEAAGKALVQIEQGKVPRVPLRGRIYQFRITLKGSRPPIWRRIQTLDCTLDQLHHYIQAVMGWMNSHLHQFTIDGVVYGNPNLICDGYPEDEAVRDSRRTKLSQILPEDGQRFRFEYEYDFGDGWEHEILFEGCPPQNRGPRCPNCLEGERACPPEDCGGIEEYRELLEALSDPTHERHEDVSLWCPRGFDAEFFDADHATAVMRSGLSGRPPA